MDPVLMILITYGGFFTLFGLWSFSAMVKDKHAAETYQWRTSELKLHTLELLGGWFGSLSAQVCVKHKIKKISYQIPFWLIVLIHFAGYVTVYVYRDQIREYVHNFQEQENKLVQ